MITFKYIRELYENEKKSRALQKLDDDFEKNIREYLERKSKLIEKASKTVIDYSIITEVENFKNILRNLLELRAKKILLLSLKHAYTKTHPSLDYLLPFEKELYEQSRAMIERSMKNIDALILGTLSEKEQIPQENREENEAHANNETKAEQHDKPTENTSNEAQMPISKPIKASKLMVEALENIPSFLTQDKDFIGPYLKGERFICDNKTAEILLANNKIKILYEIDN